MSSGGRPADPVHLLNADDDFRSLQTRRDLPPVDRGKQFDLTSITHQGRARTHGSYGYIIGPSLGLSFSIKNKNILFGP